MHEEKIWAMDFIELAGAAAVTNADDDNDGEQRNTLQMITGAGDSTVKLWSDSTLEEQVKEQESKLALMEEE